MTERRLTDAQLASALAARLPGRAQAGLRERIQAEVGATRQQRPLPSFLAPLTDIDPVTRRRSLLLAAMLLLVLSLAVAAVVGSLLRRNEPPVLLIAPPDDLIGFVRSAYDRMPELPPLSLRAIEDGTRPIDVFVDASGSVRIDHFASLDATEPETSTIYVGTSMGTVLPFQGARWWYEQAEAVSEDPRVFVYAALDGDGWGVGARCQTVLSDPGANPSAAARDIQYVGAEYVLGRPTHRVRCVGDRWIDIETRLVLRSEGPALENFEAVSGRTATIEVVKLDFQPPPASMFALEPPPGLPTMSDEDYSCATDPTCLAPPRPIPTPSADPGPVEPAVDPSALVDAAAAATERLPPFEATFRRSSTKYAGSELRVHHDGAGRYRTVETREASGGDLPTIFLVDGSVRYESFTREDGTQAWHRHVFPDPRPAYPLVPDEACQGGWAAETVDLIAGRPADAIACPSTGSISWIDRELGVVVRVQGPTDPRYGTDITELVSIRFEDQPDDLFVLPADAVVVDQ